MVIHYREADKGNWKKRRREGGRWRGAKQRGTKKKEYLNRKAKAARKQTPFKREIDCERLLPQWESRSCVHSGNRDSITECCCDSHSLGHQQTGVCQWQQGRSSMYVAWIYLDAVHCVMCVCVPPQHRLNALMLTLPVVEVNLAPGKPCRKLGNKWQSPSPRQHLHQSYFH